MLTRKPVTTVPVDIVPVVSECVDIFRDTFGGLASHAFLRGSSLSSSRTALSDIDMHFALSAYPESMRADTAGFLTRLRAVERRHGTQIDIGLSSVKDLLTLPFLSLARIDLVRCHVLVMGNTDPLLTLPTLVPGPHFARDLSGFDGFLTRVASGQMTASPRETSQLAKRTVRALADVAFLRGYCHHEREVRRCLQLIAATDLPYRETMHRYASTLTHLARREQVEALPRSQQLEDFLVGAQYELLPGGIAPVWPLAVEPIVGRHE